MRFRGFFFIDDTVGHCGGFDGRPSSSLRPKERERERERESRRSNWNAIARRRRRDWITKLLMQIVVVGLF